MGISMCGLDRGAIRLPNTLAYFQKISVVCTLVDLKYLIAPFAPTRNLVNTGKVVGINTGWWLWRWQWSYALHSNIHYDRIARCVAPIHNHYLDRRHNRISLQPVTYQMDTLVWLRLHDAMCDAPVLFGPSSTRIASVCVWCQGWVAVACMRIVLAVPIHDTNELSTCVPLSPPIASCMARTYRRRLPQFRGQANSYHPSILDTGTTN